MVDLAQYRLSRLTELAAHWRRLADALRPDPVSNEIAAFAEELDDEAERIRRECLGRRACPCQRSGACPRIGRDEPRAESFGMKAAA